MEIAAAVAAVAGTVAALHIRKNRVASPGLRRCCVASCRELIEAASGGSTASYGSTGNDESHLYAALNELGVPYDVRAWDDESVDWSSYCCVFVRTTWDYSSSELHATRFRAWLGSLCDAGVPCFNHSRILAWNCHKGYLADLAELGGIPVIPTVYVPAGCSPEDANLSRIAADKGWSDLLLKPCVGGGSRGCMRVRVAQPGAMEEGQAFLNRHVHPVAGGASGRRTSVPSLVGNHLVSPTAAAALPRLHSGRMDPLSGRADLTPEQARVQAAKLATAAAAAAELDTTAGSTPTGEPARGFPHGVGPEGLVSPVHLPGVHDVAYTPCDMMVQPYVASVEEEGELSVIVLNGTVSHAVVKAPAPGDFRTQEEHGGSPRPKERRSLTAQEQGLVQRVLDSAKACVEARGPPLGAASGACSPAHRDSLLPLALPTTPNPLLIARVDFLRLTPAVAQALGPRALAECRLDPASTPLLLLELEAIEPCLFLAVDREEREREGSSGSGAGAAMVLARAVRDIVAQHQ